MSYLGDLLQKAVEFTKGAVNNGANLAQSISKIPSPSEVVKSTTKSVQTDSRLPATQQGFRGLIANAIVQIKDSGLKNVTEDSSLGILKNTFSPSSLSKSAVATGSGLAKGIYDNQANPSEEQKYYEEMFLPYSKSPSNIVRMYTAPNIFVKRQISRFINPGLQPLATDLAEIYEVQRPGGFADQVAEGKLPVSFLDELAVLQKTSPQIIGDVAQAVLTAYGGSAAESALVRSEKLGFRESFKQGSREGLEVGTVFGAAQAASSGSTDPLEILATVGTSGAGGSLIGGIVSGTIPASKELVTKVKQIAKQHSDILAKYGGEGGFVKNPFDKKVPFDEKQIQAEAYVQEQIKKREDARVAEGDGKYTVTKLYEDLKKNAVDKTYPIEDAVRAVEKASGIKYSDIELSPYERIHNAIDRSIASPRMAAQFAEDHGLRKVIREVDKPNNLDQYLVAKQSIYRDTQGVEVGYSAGSRNLQKDIGLVHTFGKRYEPYTSQVRDYGHLLLDKMVEYGIIAPELSKILKDTNPDYIPMDRVFNELEKPDSPFGSKGVANLSKQTVIRTIKGSIRQVENPLASLLAKTVDVFTQGEKNKAALVLVDIAQSPGGKELGMRKLKDGESPASEMDKITLYRNGIKETWEAPREIAEAAKNLNSVQMGTLGKWIASPVRLAKLTTTGINPSFGSANPFKDLPTAYINSKSSVFSFIKSAPAALWGAVRHGELYKQMVREGAGGTSFDIARNNPIETVESIRAGKNIKERLFYTAKHPIKSIGDLVRAIEGIFSRSEELTRMLGMKAEQERLKSKGASQEAIDIKSAIAARENTTNFQREGRQGPVLKAAFLYISPSIQGSRRLLRNFRASPGKTATKAMFSTVSKITTTLLFPMAALTAWNLSDPTRKKVYEDFKEYEKDANLIFITDDAKFDEDTNTWTGIIKIPLPPGVGSLTRPLRKSIEDSQGISEVAFSDLVKGLIGSVSPIGITSNEILSNITPHQVKVPIESFVNKKLYTGQQIVPDNLLNKSPEFQVKKNTSGTARIIGKQFGWSPIQVEEFVKGSLAGGGNMFVNIVDRAMAGLGVIPEDQIGGKEIADSIMARFNQVKGGAISDKLSAEIKEADIIQNDDIARLEQGAELLFDAMKKMPNDEAILKLKEIMKVQPEVGKELLDIIEKDAKGMEFTDRQMLRLQVENGARAKFIAIKLKSLEGADAQVKYLKDLRDKDILTDSVLSQLTAILAR